MTNGCSDVRYAYAASRGEGEHACVIGPNEEIVAEFYDSPFIPGMDLACAFAAMLNDRDDNHCCNYAARRPRAQHLLLLARQNEVRDNETLETLSLAIEEAGVAFNRAEIAEFVGVPF